jgi:hypothetical protein
MGGEEVGEMWGNSRDEVAVRVSLVLFLRVDVR